MTPFSSNIIDFLNAQTIVTVAFKDLDDGVYALSCFFLFDEKNGLFVMKSSPGTHHGTLMKASSMVSGTVLPDMIEKTKIRGIQYKGKIGKEGLIEKLSLSVNYYTKYPFATLIPGYIWTVELDWIKMTDNTKGFGSKFIWNRDFF